MPHNSSVHSFEDVLAEFLQAQERGESPDPEDYQARYPELAEQVQAFFENRERFAQLAKPLVAANANPDTVDDVGDSSVSKAPGDLRSFGDYEILEQIASGGMGVVYKARQQSADRIVALKVIRPDKLDGLADDERRRVVERFQMEAQAAAQLEHDHIVPVYDVGEVDGQPYYSMRLIDGVSLQQLLTEGPLDDNLAAQSTAQPKDSHCPRRGREAAQGIAQPIE